MRRLLILGLGVLIAPLACVTISYVDYRILVLGLCTLLGVPLAWIAYIHYRIFTSQATILYSPVSTFWSRTVSPWIVYRGVTTAAFYLNKLAEMETFEVRPDDVFIAGYPRSGTTWTQELVYLIANDADTGKSTSEASDKRIPNLESFLNYIKDYNTPSPRFFKTHLHYHMLPPQVETSRPKIVYIMRNPKDTLVSFFHMLRSTIGPVKADFELFVKAFLDNKVPWCPWSDHVKGFWERRDQENILFIQYEDMIKDVDGAVRKIASFLEKTLTDEQVATVIQHCSFNSMKHNDKANFKWIDQNVLSNNIGEIYIRKGKVGDWKNYYTKDLSEQMEKMVAETLSGTGLTVEYELD